MKSEQDDCLGVMIPRLPDWYRLELKENWDELVKISGLNDELLNDEYRQQPKQGSPQ